MRGKPPAAATNRICDQERHRQRLLHNCFSRLTPSTLNLVCSLYTFGVPSAVSTHTRSTRASHWLTGCASVSIGLSLFDTVVVC
jgi:hypothetical protein